MTEDHLLPDFPKSFQKPNKTKNTETCTVAIGDAQKMNQTNKTKKQKVG